MEVIENDRVESISVADALERIAKDEEDSISLMASRTPFRGDHARRAAKRHR